MQNRRYLFSGIAMVIALAIILIALFIIRSRQSTESIAPLSTQKEISISEVARHSWPNDCWVYIGGQVFNATPLIAQNTSQQTILSSVCGTDGATIYTVQKYADQTLSRTDIVKLREQLSAYQIGLLVP